MSDSDAIVKEREEIAAGMGVDPASIREHQQEGEETSWLVSKALVVKVLETKIKGLYRVKTSIIYHLEDPYEEVGISDMSVEDAARRSLRNLRRKIQDNISYLNAMESTLPQGDIKSPPQDLNQIW